MKILDPIPGVPTLPKAMVKANRFKWAPVIELWQPIYVKDQGNKTLVSIHTGPAFYTDLSPQKIYTTICSVYLVNPADLQWHYEQCLQLKQSVPLVAPGLDDVFIALKMRTMDKENRNDGAVGYVSVKAIASVRPTSLASCAIRMQSGYEFEVPTSHAHTDRQRRRGNLFNWQLRGLNWATRPDFLEHDFAYSHKPNR